MKRKYTCENFGECDQADGFEPFELDEHEEKKCPKCGRDDTLVEEEQGGKGGGGNNPFINKLKTPLVAGIIGGVALLGGGAYYCLSGDSVCFSNSTSTQEKEEREREAQIQKEKEEKVRQARIQKEKEEREREARIQKEKEEREREAQIQKEQEEKARQARIQKEKEEREREARIQKEQEEKARQARIQKEKEERERQARIQKEKEEREREARIQKEKEEKARQARIQKEKEEREREARIQKEKEEKARQAQIEREKNKKYSLTINKPSGSRVTLVNLPKNMTYHDGIKIKNGTNVHIRIKKDGFKTKDLWVKMDRNINKTIHLEPKPKIEPVIHESYINEDEYVEQSPIEQHTTTTVVIVPSSSKSCRDDLEELKRLKQTDSALAARKRLEISKSNKCSASETAELLKL